MTSLYISFAHSCTRQCWRCRCVYENTPPDPQTKVWEKEITAVNALHTHAPLQPTTRMFKSFNLARVSAPTAAAARVSRSFSMSKVFHAPERKKGKEALFV